MLIQLKNSESSAYMGLTGRKEKILQAVVDGYIENCQPVSSSEIREKHLPALSSATIRNEMAALEEMGYFDSNCTLRRGACLRRKRTDCTSKNLCRGANLPVPN